MVAVTFKQTGKLLLSQAAAGSCYLITQVRLCLCANFRMPSGAQIFLLAYDGANARM